MRSVREVLESRSVAVFGASRDPLKPGALILKVLQDVGFQGQVAGINPQGGEMHGVRLYRSLDEIPFPVDLAVMLIPPGAVPGAVAECGRRGVKGVVITSEGFAESGPAGSGYQEQVRRILAETGMRGFGPNTLGLVNTATKLTTSYFSDKRTLEPGSVGFAAQSGIFVGALLRYLSSLEGLGISKGLGMGNKVDVDECDALAYLREDEQTRVVGLYLEGIRDGRRFLEEARRTVRKKPVLLLKGGRTAEGARATASHTASLAVDDHIVDGALRQAGVLRMAGIDELIGTLKGLLWTPLPKGDRIALVTYSGAQAIMSVDKAVELGLGISRFSPETREKLSSVIATAAKARNPVDLFPDMMIHGFEKTSTEILKALLEDEGVHGVLFISFAIWGSEPYRPLVDLIKKKPRKPIFFSLLGPREEVELCRAFLETNRIPFFLFPELGVQAFANMWRYARRLRALR
ncbi:MAG: CoA-binding protein [bacterium]